MNKFKMGDFVVSKNYGYELEVMFVDGNTFSGRFTKGKKKNVIENYFSVFNFEKVKEDKMENRIVSKLEDLDGLENGMGLYLQKQVEIRNGEFETILCLMHNKLASLTFELSSENIEDFNILKAMGFKFEFQKLRTVEEVLEEITKLENGKFSGERVFNYYLYLDHNDNKYKIDYCDAYENIGVTYMNKVTAQKYADELNEIVGGK